MGAAPAQLSGLETVFGNVVTSLLALGGIVLFLMLLSSGFKYLTSGGDPKAAEGAQKTFTYAIGGLVMLAGSYIILKIISQFTGATNILNFTITK
jgi:hypothetical protein